MRPNSHTSTLSWQGGTRLTEGSTRVRLPDSNTQEAQDLIRHFRDATLAALHHVPTTVLPAQTQVARYSAAEYHGTAVTHQSATSAYNQGTIMRWTGGASAASTTASGPGRGTGRTASPCRPTSTS
jgi:hypothetical protein